MISMPHFNITSHLYKLLNKYAFNSARYVKPSKLTKIVVFYNKLIIFVKYVIILWN